MGSVCCTASRAQDMGEASDGWSMEQSGHVNTRATHGALSPPPISSQWDRRPHFSELAASYNGMLFNRTTSSSSRSYSNSMSSESHVTASHRRCETSDGLLAVFNSPSESFRYFQHPLDHTADSVTVPSGEQAFSCLLKILTRFCVNAMLHLQKLQDTICYLFYWKCPEFDY
ncbi:hypothetical protein L7F22_068695 [Adiantum nelumboides]|nr:hypothetical protein [Adiantum nelumboides]